MVCQFLFCQSYIYSLYLLVTMMQSKCDSQQLKTTQQATRSISISQQTLPIQPDFYINLNSTPTIKQSSIITISSDQQPSESQDQLEMQEINCEEKQEEVLKMKYCGSISKREKLQFKKIRKSRQEQVMEEKTLEVYGCSMMRFASFQNKRRNAVAFFKAISQTRRQKLIKTASIRSMRSISVAKNIRKLSGLTATIPSLMTHQQIKYRKDHLAQLFKFRLLKIC